MLRYLIDENMPPLHAEQMRRQNPDLIVRVIGEPSMDNMSIGETIEELLTVAKAAFDDEFQDRIDYLPVS